MWIKLSFTGLLFFVIASFLVPLALDKTCPDFIKYGIMLMWFGSVLTIIISVLVLIWS